jgi:hypothetical protein
MTPARAASSPPRVSGTAAACTILQFGDDRLADALDLAKPRRQRCSDFGKRAELGDQLLGQRLYVALRNGASNS